MENSETPPARYEFNVFGMSEFHETREQVTAAIAASRHEIEMEGEYAYVIDHQTGERFEVA